MRKRIFCFICIVLASLFVVTFFDSCKEKRLKPKKQDFEQYSNYGYHNDGAFYLSEKSLHPMVVVLIIVVGAASLALSIFLLFRFIRMTKDIHFIKLFIENRYSFNLMNKTIPERNEANKPIETNDTNREDKSNDVDKYDVILKESPYYTEFKAECFQIYQRTQQVYDFCRETTAIVAKFNEKAKKDGFKYDFNLFIYPIWHDLNNETSS